ncbi:MAG: arginine--tRNA ligase [Candidatus Hodarchaeales archaeon]
MIIDELIDFFSKAGVSVSEQNFSRTPKPELGDISCNIAFILAKKQKKNPAIIAEEIKTELQPFLEESELIRKIKVAGPYINVFYNRGFFCRKILSRLEKIVAAGVKAPDPRCFLLEYFQPNTHKALHVGHLRNGVLGAALSRLLQFTGNEVITTTFIGDIGAHIAKWLWYYTNYVEDRTIPENDAARWSADIYTAASIKEAEIPRAKEEIAKIQSALENGDEELTRLWKLTRAACLDDLKIIMDELGIEFTKFYFESDTEKKGKELVQDLLDRKIAVLDQGAPIIDMESRGIDLPNFLLLKSDGSSLYQTKDLPLALEKEKDFDFDESLFVISSEQTMYLKQLFKTLELIGYKKKNTHVNYGIVTLKEGKMSSRAGNVVYYADLRDRMLDKARKEIRERNPGISPDTVDSIAKQIVFGAMKFSMLNTSNRKNVIFDLEKSLRFDGKTGAYIQYTGVRTRKILEKCESIGVTIEDINEHVLGHITDLGYSLVKKMAEFEEIAINASRIFDPSSLAVYVFELSQMFNLLYADRNILHEKDPDVQQALISIITVYYRLIEKILFILGFEIPAFM